MSKIIVIPNTINNISNIDADAILLGINNYSVNTLNINIDDLNLLNFKGELFISLNKNLMNEDLDIIEDILIKLNNYNIKGVFYYDVGLLNIAKRLDLNYDLIWSAEHLTTNYFTINYWKSKGVNGTFLSNEITIDEMLSIRENTDSKLIAQMFGYIPMYVSKRHAVNNYIKNFNLDSNSNKYYIYKEEKKYHIVDNNDGTMIYSSFILNGLEEYLDNIDKFDYILINGFEISDKDLLKVIDIYKNVNKDNLEESNKMLSDMFDNLGKGFLHEESIYRVKKDDK